MTAPNTILGLHAVAPVLATTDLTRWLAHYDALGFRTEGYDGHYGFAWTDDVELHVSVNPDHDPATTAACVYLHVDDPDAVWRRWSAVDGGRDVAPVDTDHGIREGAHVDPDGNLLRYGRTI